MSVAASVEVPPSWRDRLPPVVDLFQYSILLFIAGSALAGAFTHMHDWTIRSIDAALEANGFTVRTPDWIGWVNAVISELLPMSSFVSIQQRRQQRRSAVVPSLIFVGSFTVSILAQLSATGRDIPYSAELLATLPALAVLILSKVILSDVDHAAKVKARAAEGARRKARTQARRAAYKAEQARLAAEKAAEQARRAAEIQAERLAEKQRRDAEILAEQRRRDAEHQARLEREAREHAARLELEKVRAEQTGITERERIKAQMRERELAAEQRRLELERQAEAERVKAAEKARREAAERVKTAQPAARTGGGGGEVPTSLPKYMPREERQALVDAVLASLPPGTERADAVKAVVAQLGGTAENARKFVPSGWVAGPVEGSAGRARLSVVGGG